MPDTRGVAIDVVIVLHESAMVIEGALRSLAGAAPRRGCRPLVVDNASTDDGLKVALQCQPTLEVVRCGRNAGFAAGVNAGLARARSDYVAIMNPDLRFMPSALDLLADHLDSHPSVDLVGPRVDLADQSREPTAGHFPTLERERNHALFLDRMFALPGRRRAQPATAEPVDWISGCAWLVRSDRPASVRSLDEGYFMYVEDIDFCRRLRDAGREVWVLPSAHAIHARGTGSTSSGRLPADGGRALLRYFESHASTAESQRVRGVLRMGWRLRAAMHGTLARLGRSASASLAARYRRAYEELGD